MSRTRYSTDPVVERSLDRALRDGMAHAIMSGCGEVYFSAYALSLGADPSEIGLLAAAPPLLGSFAQLLAARIERDAAQRRRLILSGVAVQAFAWPLILILPWLFPDAAVALFIACVVLYYAAWNFASPVWNSLLGDLVPEARRGRFFARRTRLMSLTTFLALLAAGTVLHQADRQDVTALGFAAIFVLAAFARLYSFHQIREMVEPPRASPTQIAAPNRAWWRRLRQSRFAQLATFNALTSFAVMISAPFFTVYMLRDLGFSYLEFTAVTGVSVLAQFLTLNTWGRLSDVFGNRVILVATGMLIPVMPALWLVSTDFRWILLIQILGGFGWAGFALASSNYLYDTIAPDRRARYLAYNGVLTACGVGAGALTGGMLAEQLPASLAWGGFEIHWPSALSWLFLLSALARAICMLVFLPRLPEPRVVRPLRASRALFRITQYHAQAGFSFGLAVFQRWRRRPAGPGAG